MTDPPVLDRHAAAREVRIETHAGGRTCRTIIWVADPAVALVVGDLRMPLAVMAATDAES